MRADPKTVNRRSLLAAWLCAIVPIVLSAGTAHADQVVVMRAISAVDANADPDLLDQVEDHIIEAIRAEGHEPTTEANALQVDSEEIPQTAGEMAAIAGLANSRWALLPIVRPSNVAGVYWLTLRVGFVDGPRLEELEGEVRPSREPQRITELVHVVLQEGGLTEEAMALAGEDRVAREIEAGERLSEEEEARRRAEEEAAREEEERRRQEEEEARQRAEEEAAAAAARAEEEARLAFENRDRYGVADGLWMVQAGLGWRPIVRSPQGNGGMYGTLELRGGRGFESLPGFELRLGVELGFGDVTSFSAMAGAVYLHSPFAIPLHIGAGLELGFLMPTSGNRTANFQGRVTAILSYNLTGAWYIEASLPEISYLSANEGVVSLGVAARFTARF